MSKDLYEYEREAYERRKRHRGYATPWRTAFMVSVLVWGILCIALLATAAKSSKAPAEEQTDVESVEITEPETEPAAAPEEDLAIYHLEAIEFYPVPLDHDLQAHIIRTCESYGIAPTIVFAMINRESDFDADTIGDGGESYGLLQVKPRYHSERMKNHGVTDLLDPYGNVLVGIDYLAELLDKYDGNMEKALVGYNAGPRGAYEHYFSKGIYSSYYSREVLMNSEKLREGDSLGNF